MAFSLKMGPDQLAEWLVNQYGPEYKDDIDKLRGEKVNGELFLDLPDDEEWLKELGLSRGFKRLVVKKAKELKRKASRVEADSGDGGSSCSSGDNTETTNKSEQQPQGQVIDPKTGVLTMDHFRNVHDAIWDARVQYHNIGIELGISSDDVDAIAENEKGNVEKCFARVLKQCLQKGISQKKIADALQSKTVGYGHLGQQFLAMTFVTRASSGADAYDFDQFDVKNHHLSLLESPDGGGKVRVYNSAAAKWKLIAERLGLESGVITSIHRNNYDDHARVTEVFRHWFDNANSLPNKKKYPKKWSGLIKLLVDSELGELAENLQTVLHYCDLQ